MPPRRRWRRPHCSPRRRVRGCASAPDGAGSGPPFLEAIHPEPLDGGASKFGDARLPRRDGELLLDRVHALEVGEEDPAPPVLRARFLDLPSISPYPPQAKSNLTSAIHSIYDVFINPIFSIDIMKMTCIMFVVTNK